MQFFKKLRFFFRLSRAFLKKRFLIIFLGAIVGVFSYFLLSFLFQKYNLFRKTEKIGLVGKYSLEDIPEEILQYISFGLTEVTPEGEVIPRLCDRWEISPDEKVYSFYFGKKKFFWHDGSEFNANDINYNFKDAKVLQIDSYLLKIVLNEPFSPLLSVLSQPVFKKGLIGLGEYRVDKIESTGKTLKSILLKPKTRTSSLPNLHFKFYINESYLKTGFSLGEIDKISEIDNNRDFLEIKNLVINKVQKTDRYLALYFNTAKDPFSDKNFRQAVAYSLAKFPEQKRALSPISPSSLFFNPGVKKYDQDLAKSKLLLEKVKIEKDKVFTIYTFTSLENQAKTIQEELKKIGLNTEIKFSSLSLEDFDLFLAIEKIPQDPDQYIYWHTGQGRNLSRFSNPRIDKLLEDGRKTIDSQERKKIYFDFQRFLAEETPAIFLYYPSYYSIERK